MINLFGERTRCSNLQKVGLCYLFIFSLCLLFQTKLSGQIDGKYDWNFTFLSHANIFFPISFYDTEGTLEITTQEEDYYFEIITSKGDILECKIKKDFKPKEKNILITYSRSNRITTVLSPLFRLICLAIIRKAEYDNGKQVLSSPSSFDEIRVNKFKSIPEHDDLVFELHDGDRAYQHLDQASRVFGRFYSSSENDFFVKCFFESVYKTSASQTDMNGILKIMKKK